MSRIQVQCKGSGRVAAAGFNTKKTICPGCGKLVAVFHTNTGTKFRKHMRNTTTARLRRGR